MMISLFTNYTPYQLLILRIRIIVFKVIYVWIHQLFMLFNYLTEQQNKILLIMLYIPTFSDTDSPINLKLEPFTLSFVLTHIND